MSLVDRLGGIQDTEAFDLRHEAMTQWCQHLSTERLLILARLQQFSTEIQLAALYPVVRSLNYLAKLFGSLT